MKKIAALDFGEARIGLAVSDESKKIALPRTTLSAKKNLEESAASVASSLVALGPLEAVIVGLPLFMNGKESPMSQKVRKFGALLEEKFGFCVIFRDERLTSAQGERVMQETEAGRKQRKKLLDGIAACIILQNYLDALSR
ncbi:MAG: Holliday junction resolvase RuvX [Chlamydiales bacterium]